MRENGYITEAEHRRAVAEPLRVASRNSIPGDAQWFLDVAMDQLDAQHGSATQSRVYTTLDPDLQRAALDAVAEGLPAVDAQLRSRRLNERPQVALIALDSHTGEVKAVVGGRDFNVSQFNHVTAMRQPGSVFKPFVYASAIQPGESRDPFTAASTVEDVPRSFSFDGQIYEPSNHGDHFHGTVTLRNALAKSMNIAAVSVAEKVGYKHVLEMARRAGLNDRMRATPSIALGAYEATPLEMAAAYTIFANRGRYVPPSLIREVRSFRGELRHQSKRSSERVLTREAAFVMQDMLEEVLRSGTAASARHKLRGRAAGKTGTSRDGWFVGYTSNLICAVWIGFDTNQDLDLEGARSAMPVWTAFMRAAGARSRYREELDSAPKGVAVVLIDTETGMRAGADCPLTRREYFIAGTEPTIACTHDVIPEEMPSVGDSAVVTVSQDATVNPLRGGSLGGATHR
jgi:penicillin-binding protein 1B